MSPQELGAAISQNGESCAPKTPRPPIKEQSEKLFPGEREVLNLLSAGYIYKEISDHLDIGLETVRTYVKNICEKMHVRNRVEAVARHGSKAT